MTSSRPVSPTTLKALIGFLIAITFGSVRDFVWADLREGILDVRQIPRGARALALAGLALLVFMLGLLLFNDVLREGSALYALPETLAGRGTVVPSALMPVILMVLVIGWSFLLLGAMRSHWLLCLITVIYCLSSIGTWLMFSLIGTLSVSGDMGQLVQVMLASLGALGIPVIVLVRRRRTPRPLLEFILLLICLTIPYGIAQAATVSVWRNFGAPIVFGSFAFTVESVQLLAIPLLLTVGIDMANFARDVSGWVSRAASERLPGVWARILLGLVAAACLWRILSESWVEIISDAPSTVLREFAGAGMLIVLLLAACALMLYLGRANRSNNTAGLVARSADRFALPLVLLVHAPGLVSLIITQLTGLFAISGFAQTLLNISNWLNNTLDFLWRDGIFVAGAILAVWLARRQRVGLACYLITLFVVHLWDDLTAPNHIFSALTWNAPVMTDAWLTLLIVGVGVAWLLQGQLSPLRVGLLFTCLLITTLIRKTDFINNPFSPISSVFGFGGLGFIAFGILWDAINIGSWANQSSRSLPRPSRIFLYFGYVLLTVCAVNWALTSHNLTMLNYLTGQIAGSGFSQFGKPMLYAFVMVTLLQPAMGRESVVSSQ